ncbi:MAG: NUDIX domain-containing protein [bacterium]|nr:NUDIX domain-containing protein [bacterium]
MDFSFPGAYPKQLISLTFNANHFSPAMHVLVYAFYQDKLLFTHHRQRGWELPGGKCLINESTETAAIREVFEETGADLDFIKPIAQYTITHPRQTQQIKTIFVAHVQQINSLPIGFETDKIQLIGPPPTAETIIANPEFSMLLKDNVYRFSLPVALEEIIHLCAAL